MVLAKKKYRGRSKQIARPEVAARIFAAVLKAEHPSDQDKEHFWTVGLTTRNTIKYIELVSLGILNASLVHPREVFRTAIMNAASSLILVHNHPSGDPEPSQEDLTLTRRLIDAGRVMGIEILDHIIVVCDSINRPYKSLKEDRLI